MPPIGKLARQAPWRIASPLFKDTKQIQEIKVRKDVDMTIQTGYCLHSRSTGFYLTSAEVFCLFLVALTCDPGDDDSAIHSWVDALSRNFK